MEERGEVPLTEEKEVPDRLDGGDTLKEGEGSLPLSEGVVDKDESRSVSRGTSCGARGPPGRLSDLTFYPNSLNSTTATGTPE